MRFSGPGLPYEGLVNVHGRWNGQVRLIAEHLEDPLRWRRPRRVFVNSMSDLFHEALPFETIAAIFGIMQSASQHTFQVLTKRPQRMLEFFAWLDERAPEASARWVEQVANAERRCGEPVGKRNAAAMPGQCLELADHADSALELAGSLKRASFFAQWPAPNIHLGVSVENQDTANERIPLLLECPAAVRFLSVEPMLSRIYVAPYFWHTAPSTAGPWRDWSGKVVSRGRGAGGQMMSSRPSNALHWVICGCESGHGRRPTPHDWARELKDQCEDAGVAFYLKQLEEDGRVVKAPHLDGRQWLQFPGEVASG